MFQSEMEHVPSVMGTMFPERCFFFAGLLSHVNTCPLDADDSNRAVGYYESQTKNPILFFTRPLSGPRRTETDRRVGHSDSMAAAAALARLSR